MERVNTPSSRAEPTEAKAAVLSTQLERNYTYTTASTNSLTEKKSIQETIEHVTSERREGAPNMEEIALKALHVDDDPTLNPWTFRVFFIGWSLPYHQSRRARILSLTSHRNRTRSISFWLGTGHYLHVQAPKRVGINHLSHCHIICWWQRHGVSHTTEGCAGTMVEPS